MRSTKNSTTVETTVQISEAVFFSPDTIKDSHVTGRTHRKAVQALAKMFWVRFIQEYLPMLHIHKK